MKIRPAAVEDAKDISNIYALSWKSAYKGLVPQQYLDELKHDFWVFAFQDWIRDNVLSVHMIFDDSMPVGCIAYGKSRDAGKPDWGEIVSIYLLPEYFGKGYGHALFEAALSDLKESGYKNVYLWVLNENAQSRKFYEKHGFQCNNDQYEFEIMGKKLVDVRYVLPLIGS